MAPMPVIESVVFPVVAPNSAAEPVDENSRAKITTRKERELFLLPRSLRSMWMTSGAPLASTEVGYSKLVGLGFSSMFPSTHHPPHVRCGENELSCPIQQNQWRRRTTASSGTVCGWQDPERVVTLTWFIGGKAPT
jgi:hypothetical protein